jgi:cobalt-zinc-cadmium resistance protein CzcA
MVNKLIAWALNNPLIVILLALALIGVGTWSFISVNVEAYPDPAPAIVEVVAQYPGASAEEVERQVTIPLEVALAGMRGLTYTRSKSLFGLAHLRNQFDYGIDFEKAKQEVINRLQLVSLPPGVTPQISPATPTGEILRYTLSSPKVNGRDIYTLNDLKALQDWVLEREFRRVPGIADVTSSGGTVKRYEIHPDPELLQKQGITLQQLQTAIANSNSNIGGDYLKQGNIVLNVRGIGLLGGGLDPVQHVLGLENKEATVLLDAAHDLDASEKARLKIALSGQPVQPPLTPQEEARYRSIRQQAAVQAAIKATTRLRQEENRRIREIRDIVITSVNNVPVRVEEVVEGGPVSLGKEDGAKGVVVGYQTRLGRVSLSKRDTKDGREVLDEKSEPRWKDEDDKVQGIVLLRKGEDSLPALRAVEAKIKELNSTPGRLLPGVQLVPYYDRTDLIHVTTETVRENLAIGMVLVTVILLMFLSNVRSALIVAINIPLALLFAFSVLFLRGKSANLLSIGAVDFGIIVDSTVIMVENIYRHLSSGEYAGRSLKERILQACHEVERSLFFSTIIMVCALLPLFTMSGPEGQIFGPMADTYAFALGGALLLAFTLSPVLCLLFFRNLKPARDNFLVRWLKTGYLWQLEWCLNYRWVSVGIFGLLVVLTGVLALPRVGREFMPELEEGNLWIRGTFPINISLDEVADKVKTARHIMHSYPEVETVVSQLGRPDDGTDPTGFYNVETFVPLKPMAQWPKVVPQEGLFGWLWPKRSRTKEELVKAMDEELSRIIAGVDWDFSQVIRDNVMEALSGVKGENSVKIFGPDLDELERLADEVKNTLAGIRGIENAGVFRIKGQSNLEMRIDREKCARWGVSVNDVNNVIESAVRGKPFTQMIEGEKLFDVILRFPAALRSSEYDILKIPVDVPNNTVTGAPVGSVAQTPQSGQTTGISASGTSNAGPALTGSSGNATHNNLSNTPHRLLGDLVSPVGADGMPDPNGQFIRPGASTIYREQGQRLIAVKFSVRGRDLAGAVAEAQEKTHPLIQAPYRTEWSGEFEEMEHAEKRMLLVVSLSLVLIVLLLYLAFLSLLDAVVVLSNVLAMSLGGIWALVLTGTNFNVSAAVGFISILGVAVMNGLLMVSAFNQLRHKGVALRPAILTGVEKLVRPVTMTALAAIFGLLPAALSTRIGSQSQRPLAIVVVGGMLMTLVLMNLVPVLYSFYGKRQPPAGAGDMTH